MDAFARKKNLGNLRRTCIIILCSGCGSCSTETVHFKTWL